MLTHPTSSNPVQPPDTLSTSRTAAAQFKSDQTHDYIEDVSTVSRNFTALADRLAQLQQSDPAKFQQVQQTIVQKLTAAAQQSSGFRGSILAKMANAFAASGENAPSITITKNGQGAADIQATANELLTHIFDAVSQIPGH
jgi:hypothetical protein